MDGTKMNGLDPELFRRVWQRVMPEPREDCPFIVVQPAPLPLPAAEPQPDCWGQEAWGLLPELEGFWRRARSDGRSYQLLSQRRDGRGLVPLAREKERLARQLGTAGFLISGQCFLPQTLPQAERRSLSHLLRERFIGEQEEAAAFLSAAGQGRNACLSELYRAAARSCLQCGDQVRRWLEEHGSC